MFLLKREKRVIQAQVCDVVVLDITNGSSFERAEIAGDGSKIYSQVAVWLMQTTFATSQPVSRLETR